jgi:biopolymer transport protein ExbB/TolQ
VFLLRSGGSYKWLYWSLELLGVAFIIYQLWKAKRDSEAEKELKLSQDLIREEENRIRQEEEEMRQEELQKRAQLEHFKKEQLLLEKNRYLKNRSAEEANNDALKHFL